MVVRIRSSRRAAILVLSAILMVFMLVMVAFAVDLGYRLMARTQVQSSVDCAALAAAGQLINGKDVALQSAYDYLAANKVGTKTLAPADATVEFGVWDKTARTFTVSSVSNPPAVRVTALSTGHPTFFSRVMGINNFNTTAKAVATFQPRDIVLALDFSGSMCEDSQLGAISKLGRTYVEANLNQMWADLGSPKYGKIKSKMKTYTGTNSAVLSSLGLTNVAYPYAQGSWDEYVTYVKTDSDVNAAGYKDSYGVLTWMNYLQAWHTGNSETSDLWKTSEQPITAVKDAVNLFLAYLQSNSTDDQVGFSLYTSSNGTAKLESALTKDFTLINSLVRQRQAGHYVGGTNIYDGLKTARLEILAHARIGSKKMIVLMTDGQTNMPTGNGATDDALVISEANACSAANIPIVAIALGAGADTALMTQIANITGGAYFDVPGGQSVAQVQSALQDIFAKVAGDRPLKLVQ